MDNPKLVPANGTIGVCPDCGGAIAGGREGCQALWDEFSVRGYADIRFAGLRDLAFDTYCMQHLTKYCTSAKSYAAHLTRLCCGLEHGGDAHVYAAIRRWLDGPSSLARPEAPPPKWKITIVDVVAQSAPDDSLRLNHAWATDVWHSYHDHHALAHSWIQSALKKR